jgi:hypothetical protein
VPLDRTSDQNALAHFDIPTSAGLKRKRFRLIGISNAQACAFDSDRRPFFRVAILAAARAFCAMFGNAGRGAGFSLTL